ncbi:MAG: relaxase/mobilization nuclease domain-containing protein [Clostridiales Family XIII bacterium]|nr:relaxase/mobilization nuclease domain-containing protein [Clostridiales Family XIII bacterium]
MATTKIWAVKDSVGRVVDYAANVDKTANPGFTESDMQSLHDVMEYATDARKTEKRFFVSGVNCFPETAREQMAATKRRFGKEGGNLAYHAYQSFKPGEVAPQLAHEIGVALAQEIFGGRFEVVVATHLDKGHIHNHLVINSVSCVDGKKYDDCKASYRRIRETSDRLCREHGLSVIEYPSNTKTPRQIYFAEKRGEPTLFGILREDIDDAIRKANNTKEFADILRGQGYRLNLNPERKYWTIKAPGAERSTRMYRLGKEYANLRIFDRIHMTHNRTPYVPYAPIVRQYRSRRPQRPRRKIGGLYGLYLHYMYLLGKFPAKRHRRRRVHPALREDLRKIDRFSEAVRFLCRNKLQTHSQIDAHEVETRERIKHLEAARTKIYNRLRRCDDPAEIADLKSKRDALTAAIAPLRRDLKTIAFIREHDKHVRDRIATAQEIDRAQRSRGQQTRQARERDGGDMER